MSKYYREHVSYPNVAAGPVPSFSASAAAVDDGAQNIVHAQQQQLSDPEQGAEQPLHHPSTTQSSDAATSPPGSNSKHCTVKGCAAPVPSDYPHKMCEECRGRHRKYANTKRAKRKMEKALLNTGQGGQAVVWMPEDDPRQECEMPSQAGEPVAGPSRSYEVPPINEENTQHFDFPQSWDPSALDPRLFSHASELAGALTLPHLSGNADEHHIFNENDEQQPQHPQPLPPQPLLQYLPSHRQAQSRQVQTPGPPPPPPAPEIHPALAAVLKAVPNLNLSTRITSGPTVPVGGTVPPVDGQLPPRFCSIKGCKTLIPGNSFFKMCQPCRDRYRNYGTTKRAKWRKEKEVVVHELHKLREEEDKRRAEQGLPPLPPDDDIWQDIAEEAMSTHAEAGPSTQSASEGQPGQSGPRPPRMCTVSHCREILPGDYEFLRCERHRIQNRHHSKLKRVRDKEVKAQVYDGWAAAAGVRATSTESAEEEDGGEPMNQDPDANPANNPLNLEDLERHLRESSQGHGQDFLLPPIVAESGVTLPPPAQGPPLGPDGQPLAETPLGEPTHGVPPAARGTRRTNHVCSIKSCANLLSPSNPWKMCDLCRSRDRAGRRLKALRDSGRIPPEVADGTIEMVKMEVEGKSRSASSGGAEGGEKKPKKKRKKKDSGAGAQETGGDEPQAVEEQAGPSSAAAQAVPDNHPMVQEPSQDLSGGAVAPSALMRVPPSQPVDGVSSMFGMPPMGHGPVVFMDPLSPEEAARIQSRFDKPPITSVVNAGAMAPAQPESVPTVVPDGGNGAAVSSDANSATTAAPKKRGSVHVRLPPPNYGYPPYSPPKGPYPPMCQPPPYPSYPPYYPNQPYGYPPYPPPPGQPYPLPPSPGQGYPPSGQSSPPPGQAYPPLPPPPFPYPYPLPTAYQSSPPQPQPQPQPQSQPTSPPNQQEEQAVPQPQRAPQPQEEQREPQPQEQPQPQPQGQQQQQPQQPQQQQPQQPQHQHENAGQQRPRTPDEEQSQPQQSPVLNPHFAGFVHHTHTPDPAQDPNASDGNAATSPAYARQQPERFATFIVRTGETYGHPNNHDSGGAPCTDGTKPAFSVKRKRDEDNSEPGSAYSRLRLDGSTAPTPDPGMAAGLHFQAVIEHALQAANAPAEQSSCSNKRCKRLLPHGAAGSLCTRCKERLKKKQAKAKHRFRLEPKCLVGRPNGAPSSSTSPGPSTSQVGS
ncbi:hypothetical protein BD413DRAFT_490697 [Trametes elegans]|nr:hypothetical protein BD413DRAFT_490697 [Trametes elegans]